MSRTAEYVALYRALETNQRSALFVDPFALAFLPRRYSLAVRAARVPVFRSLLLRYADRRAPGARTNAIARTCFIDEIVRTATRDGARQLVLLGAGFDCRAHRLPELGDSSVYEIDRREIQAVKRAKISLRRARNDVRYVSVDFLRDDVADSLEQAGWRADQRTIFVWEGVTNYLTTPAVEKVLGWIGRSAPGSTLVFTYVHAGLLDGSVAFEGGGRILGNVQALGEPWTFGLLPHEVGEFVGRFGLELRHDLGADEYRRRYLGSGSGRGYAFYRAAVVQVKK